MNVLRLMIFSVLVVSVHCATKKVKIKLYKIRRQHKALKHSKHSTTGHHHPRQLNVDQLIEHGEQLIKKTLQQMGQLHQLRGGPDQEQTEHLLSMLTLELTVYGNLVASLAHCQAHPKSCPRLNFHTLHEQLKRMAYYEQRIHEEVDVAKAVLIGYNNINRTSISQGELLSKAMALEGQTRKLLDEKDFIGQPALRFDSTYALYFLQQWITKVGQYKTADYAQREKQEGQAFERHRQSIKRLVRRIERL